MLLHIPAVLRGERLAQAQALMRQARWVDGRATAGPQSGAVKSNLQIAEDDPAGVALRDLVLAGLAENALFFTAALPRRIYPPLFNRYGGAMNRFGKHIDNGVRLIRHGPLRGQSVRTDLSATLFLAEPGDYDGGELVIEHSFGEQRVKLPAGDLLLYPGTSVHAVEPVTRGERLASFFWVESMVRGEDQRRLLFELDRHLLSLREQLGETEATVGLTGVYHNLLRQWAEA